MHRALLARPVWSPPLVDHASVAGTDPRIVTAPLQVLRLLDPDPRAPVLVREVSPWLVLTSPSCVEALAAWLEQGRLPGLDDPWIRLAAVGRGTTDAIAHHLFTARADAPPLMSARPVLCPGDHQRSDAQGLLAELAADQEREGFVWSRQTFLVLQGRPARPTLVDGLRQQGAVVAALDLYERCDVDWPAEIWASLHSSEPGQTGVVVTSTTVIPRLLELCRQHGVASDRLVWCTHHQTVADMLHAATRLPVRRVSLAESHLSRDLFIDERFW